MIHEHDFFNDGLSSYKNTGVIHINITIEDVRTRKFVVVKIQMQLIPYLDLMNT